MRSTPGFRGSVGEALLGSFVKLLSFQNRYHSEEGCHCMKVNLSLMNDRLLTKLLPIQAHIGIALTFCTCPFVK